MKRTIIAICFLLIAIVVLFIIYRYQATQKIPPQNSLPTIKNTPDDTRLPKPGEIPLAKEPPPARQHQHQLQEADRQFLIAQGLHEPARDLVQDLMKHNELIPCKGDVGGAPGFYNPDGITVLSKSQVIANYDDGHVEGTIELSFTVLNGTVLWKVTHADCSE